LQSGSKVTNDDETRFETEETNKQKRLDRMTVIIDLKVEMSPVPQL